MWIWIIVGAFVIGGIGNHMERKTSELEDRVEELENEVERLTDMFPERERRSEYDYDV